MRPMTEKKIPYEKALAKIKDAKKTGATELDLMWLKLTNIPSEIGQLTNLSHLFLNSNQLTSLPPEIGQLTKLTHLYLRNNQLTSLPPEIGQLKNLTKLHLRDNQLTSLPPEIVKLNNLSILGLRDNQLTDPPQKLAMSSIEAIRLYFENKELREPKKSDLLDHEAIKAIQEYLPQLDKIDDLLNNAKKVLRAIADVKEYLVETNRVKPEDLATLDPIEFLRKFKKYIEQEMKGRELKSGPSENIFLE